MLETLKLSYQISKNAWIKSYPFILYLKPTSRCNLRCESCRRWKEQSSIEEELPLEEIIMILQKFRKAGCSILPLWGGEPTLRKDLPEILAEAKKIGYRTSMCTNCLLLPRKADDILPNLDVLLCSIDGYGDAHDEFRGVKGLFDSVVKTIEIASLSYPQCYIKVWASIHKKSINQVEKLAELARQLSVGIEFFPISLIEGYNDDLVADKDDLNRAFGKVIELKHRGYPIRNPYRVLKIMKANAPFECNYGRIAIHIDHKGNVYSCEDLTGTPRHSWCSYKDFEPDKIFSSEEFKKVAKGLRKCNRCRLPCMMELSGNLFRSLPGMFFSPGRWG